MAASLVNAIHAKLEHVASRTCLPRVACNVAKGRPDASHSEKHDLRGSGSKKDEKKREKDRNCTNIAYGLAGGGISNPTNSTDAPKRQCSTNQFRTTLARFGPQSLRRGCIHAPSLPQEEERETDRDTHAPTRKFHYGPQPKFPLKP